MRYYLLNLVAAVFCSAVAHAGFAEKEQSIVFNFEIKSLEITTKDGFRLLTHGDGINDNFGIIIRIPMGDMGRWPIDSRSYKFPTIIEAVDARSREAMDTILTRKFGKGKPQTVFKPGGYAAASSRAPAELGKSGGQFSLADPGVDLGKSWNIKVDLNPEKKSLALEVSPMRF